MSEPDETNSPLCVDHFCARCLRPVAADAQECPNCSRRFVGRGRFDRLSGTPPPRESLDMMQAMWRPLEIEIAGSSVARGWM